MGFTKLWSGIVTSSVWCEDDATLRVWIALLALANADGLVEGSVPGFASLCRISIEQCEGALARLSSPDQYSRTADHDGRRIERAEGGWRILNYRVYRERGQEQDRSRAAYMRGWRSRHHDEQEPVTRNTDSHGAVTRDTEAEAEAEAEAEKQASSARARPEQGPPAGFDPAPYLRLLRSLYPGGIDVNAATPLLASVAGELPDPEAFGESLWIWAKSDDWRREGGRYVPAVRKFLTGHRWRQLPRDRAVVEADFGGWHRRSEVADILRGGGS